MPGDEEWILDSVINFVKSPLWKVPITSFINENCTVFDDEEENKLEYTEVHKKFKKIVEEMLTNMLSEIGIDEEAFAAACIKSTSNPTHKLFLSEILAVENFVAFKKLMLKRNRELNEEAFQLMHAAEAGIDPNVLYQQMNYGGVASEDDEIARAIQASLELEKSGSSGASTAAPLSEEDEMMRLALEASKREFEEFQKARKEIAMSEEKKVEEKKVEKPVDKKVKAEKPKASEKVKAEPKADTSIKAPKSLAPIGSKPIVSSDFDIVKQAEETSKKKHENEEKKKKEIEKKTMSKDEMKERMEKLRKQRDLLLQKKQEALKKEWDNYEEGDKTTGEGDSRKDMIQKGLGSLGIKESSIKYKTEEEKEVEKEKIIAMKEKEKAKKAKAKK